VSGGIDLKFKSGWTPASGNAVAIQFGLADTDAVGIRADVFLGGMSALASIEVKNPVFVDANLKFAVQINGEAQLNPPPTYDVVATANFEISASGSVEFDVNVIRLTVSSTKASFRQPSRVELDAESVWQYSARELKSADVSWQQGVVETETVEVISESSGNVRPGMLLCHSDAIRIDSLDDMGWMKLYPESSHEAFCFEDATRLEQWLNVPYVELFPMPWMEKFPWDVCKHLTLVLRLFKFNKANRYRDGVWRIPWDEGKIPPPGESVGPQPPIQPPPPPVYTPGTDIKFQCLLKKIRRTYLDFTFDCTTVTIPVLRVYFVSNSVSVVRLPGQNPSR